VTVYGTSAAGRQSTTATDELAQPTLTQSGDLEPVAYTYDANGRLETLTQGSGLEARTVTSAYDANGNLSAITDALGSTTVLTLSMVNTVNLESISTAGSAGFLLIFAFVNYTGFKLSKSINANKLIPLSGFILGFAALIILIVQQYSSNRLGVVLAIAMMATCFLSEYIYKKTRYGNGYKSQAE